MPCSSVPPGRGWAPLRGSVLSGSRTLPLSGVLLPDDQPRLAVVLPVTLDDGARALVVGLWDPRRSALQQYVSELGYGRTGHGYVVDGVGRVIAGPTPAVIGDPLPMVDLRSSIRPGSAGDPRHPRRSRARHLLRRGRCHRLDRADAAGPR